MKVIVNGKTRIVRNTHVYLHTKKDFFCYYKGYEISISAQDSGDFYVTAKDKTGMYAVQGGFGGPYCRYGIETIEDCLKMCIENILL